MPLRLAILTIFRRREPGRAQRLLGSPGGVRDGPGVLAELVEHPVELVRGAKTGH
jgi:hypothetical protein